MSRLSSGNFIDFVKKDDSGSFDAFNRRSGHLIHVYKALLFLLHQILHRFINAHFSALHTPLEQIAEHIFHVDAHLFDPLGPGEFDYWKVLLAHFNLD